MKFTMLAKKGCQDWTCSRCGRWRPSENPRSRSPSRKFGQVTCCLFCGEVYIIADAMRFRIPTIAERFDIEMQFGELIDKWFAYGQEVLEADLAKTMTKYDDDIPF